MSRFILIEENVDGNYRYRVVDTAINLAVAQGTLQEMISYQALREHECKKAKD